MPRFSQICLKLNQPAIFFVAIVLLSGFAPGVTAGAGDERGEALQAVPFDRLTPAASARIRNIAERPTMYRRLPAQTIDCDPKMFLFLVRHPEVIVGIWERMEVSKVQTQRVGPYQLLADDSAGTQCKIDLVYGDSKTHVFVANGLYTGGLAPRKITGSGVFILRSEYADNGAGQAIVRGTLDCFIQLDNFGADLLARTLSGLIGKTADHNFVETAKFLAQISQGAERNPSGMRDLALDLNQVEIPTKREFVKTIVEVAQRAMATTAAKQAATDGVPASR
ncbi:hypothetical protein SH139x_005697 [Planctomycetaceae bacterium SH139]